MPQVTYLPNPLRLLKTILGRFFSRRTARLLRMDVRRFWTRRMDWRRGTKPPSDQLHLGCGRRHVDGWLNVDVAGSQWNVDLASGRLPWPSESFRAVVAQHVIEHLDLYDELLPLLHELARVCKSEAEIWLSCPDLEKVCRAYLDDRGAALVADRQTRFPQFTLRGAPSQQIVNALFHQDGEHKNLFDFELLRWALEQAGFRNCQRVVESDLLARFPEFPARHDDAQSLYVKATR